MNLIARFINESLNVGGKLEVGAGGTLLRLQLDGRVREVPLPVAVQGFLSRRQARPQSTGAPLQEGGLKGDEAIPRGWLSFACISP